MTGSTSLSSAQRAAGKLGDLLASIEVNCDWDGVARAAEELANDLRIRGGPGALVRCKHLSHKSDCPES